MFLALFGDGHKDVTFARVVVVEFQSVVVLRLQGAVVDSFVELPGPEVVITSSQGSDTLLNPCPFLTNISSPLIGFMLFGYCPK